MRPSEFHRLQDWLRTLLCERTGISATGKQVTWDPNAAEEWWVAIRLELVQTQSPDPRLYTLASDAYKAGLLHATLDGKPFRAGVAVFSHIRKKLKQAVLA